MSLCEGEAVAVNFIVTLHYSDESILVDNLNPLSELVFGVPNDSKAEVDVGLVVEENRSAEAEVCESHCVCLCVIHVPNLQLFFHSPNISKSFFKKKRPPDVSEGLQT